MNKFDSITKPLTWFMALLLAAAVTGCGGSGGDTWTPAGSAKAITAYSIGANVGTIDQTAKTIAVAVPTGTDVTALIATYTTTGASVKVGTTAQTSGVTFNNFTGPVVYTVTAADNTRGNYTVTVTPGAPVVAGATAPTLGEAGRFVILASQGVTGGAGSAITNGDIGVMDQARSFITGFTPTNLPADGLFNELTGSTWIGELSRSYASDDANPPGGPFPAPLAYAAPHAAYATTLAMINQARTDVGVAYAFLAADPNPTAATQVCPTELGGLILTPGVYKTAVSVGITTPIQLDAQGDPNAVWIFSIAGNLTTGATGNFSFVGGVGSAKNVYWRVAGITTIAAGTTFYGNVFGYANVDVLANANITGSLYSTTASVTLITDTVTKAP